MSDTYSPDNPFARRLGAGGGYSPDNPFVARLNEPTGELRNGPATPTAGVGIADDPERGASLATIARASLAPNTEDQIRRFAAARFPTLPLDVAVKRYGVDRDGNIIYADPKTGQLVREVPTIGGGSGIVDKFMRAGHQVALGAGGAIPAAAAGIAGAVTGPTGASIPIAGLAAGAADLGRQALDRWLADEDPTKLDYANAAGQAALNAAGQAASVGLMRAIQRNPLGVQVYDRLKVRDPAEQAKWDALSQEAKARGIDLSVGQKTGLPSIMSKERALRTLPETVDQFGDFLRTQRMEQVPRAVGKEMDALAPARSIAEGADMFKSGADDVMRGLRQARSAAASPLYESAFNSGVAPDIRPVLQTISDEMKKVPERSPAGRALKEAYLLLTEEQVINAPGGRVVQRVPISDYRKLHSAKMTFDNTIAGIFPPGMPGSPATNAIKEAGNATLGVKTTLNNVLKDAHPGYRQGALEYVKGTVPINELEGTALRRVLQQDSSAAPVRYVEQVFDAAKGIPPADIARIRRAYEAAGKMNEWNAGLRSFVADRLDQAMRINASGEAGGVPGKLVKSLWGTESQRDAMKAALGSQQMATSFEKLMDVLQAASRSLPEGSPTAANLAAQNSMMMPSRAARFVGKLTSPGTLLSAGEDIVSGINELRAPAKRIALAEYLLSDQGMQKLKKLTLLSPTSQRAITLAGDILASSGARSGLRATGTGVPEPQLPEDMTVAP